MQDNFSACQAGGFRFRDKVVFSGETQRERAKQLVLDPVVDLMRNKDAQQTVKSLACSCISLTLPASS
jgi:hypothetical protein